MTIVEGGPRTGLPLVFVPPLGRGVMHFRPNLESLAAGGARVIAYDPPGSGKATKGEARLDTVEAHLGALGAVLDATSGATPAVLLGVSFGGALALRFAAEHPARVRAVIASDVAEMRRGIVGRMAAAFALSGPVLRAMPPGAWRRAIARFFPGPHANVDESAAFIERLHGSAEWRAYVDSLGRLARSALRDLDLERALARIRVPVLVLWGEVDRVAPVTFGRRMASSIPGAQLEVFAGAGHFPNVQQPEAFNASVARFLEGRGAG
jgi:3-oxoadipate enol-lactonase